MDAKVTYHPSMWVANVASPIYTKPKARHGHTYTEHEKYTNINTHKKTMYILTAMRYSLRIASQQD